MAAASSCQKSPLSRVRCAHALHGFPRVSAVLHQLHGLDVGSAHSSQVHLRGLQKGDAVADVLDRSVDLVCDPGGKPTHGFELLCETQLDANALALLHLNCK